MICSCRHPRTTHTFVTDVVSIDGQAHLPVTITTCKRCGCRQYVDDDRCPDCRDEIDELRGDIETFGRSVGGIAICLHDEAAKCVNRYQSQRLRSYASQLIKLVKNFS